MKKNIRDKNLDELFKSILMLETIDDCYDFFEDLCTVNELNSFSQRFEVARMLDRKCVYTDIASKTGASSATISRVSRSLTYGKGGYQKALEMIKNNNK